MALGKLMKTIDGGDYKIKLYQRPSSIDPDAVTVVTVMYDSGVHEVCLDVWFHRDCSERYRVYMIKGAVDYLIKNHKEIHANTHAV